MSYRHARAGYFAPRSAARITTLTLIIAACAASRPARADVVTDWNQVAIQAVADAKLGPNAATRALAIVQIAVHDALAAIDKTHAPYHAKLKAPAGALPEAAALGAAHYALIVLFPSQRVALTQKLKTALAAYPKGQAADDGVDLGVAAANDILTLRAADGALITATYPANTALGLWRPTPPANAAALEPGWRNVEPFVLESASAYRPAAPPVLTSTAYATAYNEVKAIGAKLSATRTAEQSTIAQFWAQDTYLPYNAIARQLARARAQSLSDNARLFALLNIALADSRIAAWDAKYFYGAWRPISAITSDDGDSGTDDDGNAATEPDAAWLPLLDTPAHPDYPSGHSTTGAAGATVLANWFGDEVGFTVASTSLSGTARAFASLWQTAVENGNSRIYAGIHFRYANDAGLVLGKQVALDAIDHLFAALPPRVKKDASVDDDEDAGVVVDAGEVIADAGHTQSPDKEDASVAKDAGTPRARDAGSSHDDAENPRKPVKDKDSGIYLVDAGLDDDSAHHDDDDGCSVAAVGARRAKSSFDALALLAGAAWLARRRRARAQCKSGA